MAKSHQKCDVIIVGAGVQGLCVAHTFLSIDPSLSVLILDCKSSIGGVWSEDRLYPGLRANNLQGYYEFSDFPMLDAGLEHLGVKERGIIPGEAINAYLYAYAERFGLLDLIRLNARVVKASYDEDGAAASRAWNLKVVDGGVDGADQALAVGWTITCSKLVIATGQASQPFMPSMVGRDTFSRPVIHSRELGTVGQSLLSNASVNHVTVMGGSKSAHDAVYMCALRGKKVTWLTRRSGRGGMPMARSYTTLGPWSLWLEGLVMTRPLSWFGFCPWSDGDGFGWVRGLLHRTRVGRWLVGAYFEGMSASSMDQSGILSDEKTKALIPDQNLMWYGTEAAILNYETDFYDVVKGSNVEIIREDLDHLEGGDTLILQGGHRLQTDAIICATGHQYGPSFPLEPSSKLLAWGVPVPNSNDNLFPTLDARADDELLTRFPILARSPRSRDIEPAMTPWRLWRFIAPPSQVCSGPGTRTLAFLCATISYQNVLKCELSSLWTYAYLYDRLDACPGPEKAGDVMYEAALWSRFGKWRCPMGMQGKAADFLHDAMPYYDLLMRDLGLRSWRKGWGLIGEIFGKWYEVKDYRGIVEEWKDRRKSAPLEVTREKEN